MTATDPGSGRPQPDAVGLLCADASVRGTVVAELRKRYGFSKFIIVVPSIAIYEGVIKTEEITRSHFRSLYDNEPVTLIPYDGSRLSRVRIFATSTQCDTYGSPDERVCPSCARSLYR